MDNKKSLRITVVGVLLVLIAVFAVVGFRYAKQSQKTQLQVQTASAPKAKGSDSAPVRIVGFSDFQCPACAHAGPMIDAFMEKYPGKIQYIFKHFPLRMHPWATVAHQAAECVSIQGQFWDYYKKLYSNQAVWSVAPDPMVAFAEYAQSLNINMSDFAGCMADAKVAEKVMAEKKEGEALDVRSTPTFFINGKMFAGPMELKIAGEAQIRSILGLPPEAAQTQVASQDASSQPQP